jgi:hypothetical protein
MTETAVAQSVAAGAAFLDERMPGWPERIDLDKLDLSGCWRCVLGQLFDSPEIVDNNNPFDLGLRRAGPKS